MPKLCVNIDHVATVRQARRINEPDPLQAAFLAELGGATGITCHLREDRRHIQDDDVKRLRQSVKTRLNLEMAVTNEMLDLAVQFRPHMVMFVPENRQEVTTEGGLDVAGGFERIKAATQQMKKNGLVVSHFIDPQRDQLDAARECGADVVELHTGAYANAAEPAEQLAELERLQEASLHAIMNGQRINAGHGLNLRNVRPIAAISGIRELHIGHSIVSHAVIVGFERATRDMVTAIAEGESLAARHSPEQILTLFSV